MAEHHAPAAEVLEHQTADKGLELRGAGGVGDEEHLKEAVVQHHLLLLQLHEPAHAGGVGDRAEEEAAVEDLLLRGHRGPVGPQGGQILHPLQQVGQVSQIVLDGLGRAVGGPGKGPEGGHVDKGPAVEGPHVQGAALAGGDAPGGLGRVRGELQAGGKVVGAAAGDVPQGRGIGEAHEAADRLVEGAVPAAADNAVIPCPLRLRQLRGVARVGGLAHGDQIALLAEVGHRLEQGAHGPGAPGPGVDNEQERLCHSVTAFPIQQMKILLILF